MATPAERISAFLSGLLEEYRSSYSPSTEAEAWLVRQQVTLARDGARSPALLGPLAAIALALANIRWVPLERLILWPVLVIVTGLASAIYYESLLKRVGNTIEDTRYQARVFTWLSFAQVVAWCSMGLLLWAPAQPLNHAIVGVALAISLTGWTALGTYHFATGVTSLPIFLTILTLGSAAQGRFTTMGAIAAYWLLMVLLFHSNYFTRKKMLILEHERGYLIEDLRKEKNLAEMARERAEAASRAKSAFLANMSHELRTPLNAILGFSEIINTKALGASAIEQYAEYGGYIHGSGQHLLALINDILDLARIEAGKLVLRETKVDLGGLIEDAIQSHAARAQSGGVTLETDIEVDFPLLNADERALRQIFANLVSNAVKFTQPAGRVTCFARVEADGDLVFGVRDTGIGIAAENQVRVFENFGQNRHDAVMADKGTGLGLPIVKGLAAAHGGRVLLESVLDEGTTVSVIFPPARACEALKAAV